jgi:hypothetical protein
MMRLKLKLLNGNLNLVSAVLNSQRNISFQMRFLDSTWEFKLTAGQKQNWIK